MNFTSLLRKRIFLWRYSSHPLFNRFYSEIDLSQKVKESTFTVVDVETTSPVPSKAQLLSVGAVKIEKLTLKISTCFHRFVRTEKITRESIGIHGITKEDLIRKGEKVERVIEDFLEFVKGSVMVGFNVEFDRKVLDKTAKEYLGFPLAVPRIDVITLLRRKGISHADLEKTCEELDVPLEGHHSAVDDAYTTALVFLKLIIPFRESTLSSLPVVF